MIRTLVAALLLLLVSSAAAAEELPEWIQNLRVSGHVFGDAYGVGSHHNPAIEGENGFWFRRAYLTFDSKISESTDLRLRFEANSPGDFSTSRNLDTFLKDLYVRFKGGHHELYAGLSPSVTWDLVELHWGYRHVERTPLDLYKWGAARDIGLAVTGSLDERKRVRYNVMFANGEGTKSETDDGKKVMLEFSFHPTAAWTLEAYGDADNRPGQTDRTTWQVFAGYKGERGRVGLLYAGQKRETSPTTALHLSLASVYGTIKTGDRTTLLARVDRVFDPIPDGGTIDYIVMDPTAKATFALLGLDVALNKKISLIPNVEGVVYEAVGSNPEPGNDLIGRLTLFVQY